MNNSLCLIQPPRPYLVNPRAQAPLGLLCVAGEAMEAGYPVTILDLSMIQSLNQVSLPEADVYGLTGTYLDLASILELAKMIKVFKPDSKVVVGGPVILSLSLKEPNDYIDLIVLGDGEAVIDLVMSPTAKGVFGGYDNDINFYAPPAYKLWKGKLGGNIFWKHPCEQSATVMASRGCPHRCAFCASAGLQGSRHVRTRDPVAVVDDLEGLVTDRGVMAFRFSDEYFNLNPRITGNLCEEIRRSDRLKRIEWRVSVGAKTASREVLRDMKAAGCREVSVGVECFDDEVLEALDCGKCSTFDIDNALSNAKAEGLVTRALMMVGLPYESEKSAQSNMTLMASPSVDCVAIAIFTPIPGSAIYQTPERYGCKHRFTEDTGLCLFGPNGRNKVTPKIERTDLSVEEHERIMREQIDFAESLGKVGKG